jgi:hypothetical protein
MAKELPNQEKARAISYGEAGERVSQIVNAEPRKFGFGANGHKCAPQPGRVALAPARREDEFTSM